MLFNFKRIIQKTFERVYSLKKKKIIRKRIIRSHEKCLHIFVTNYISLRKSTYVIETLRVIIINENFKVLKKYHCQFPLLYALVKLFYFGERSIS